IVEWADKEGKWFAAGQYSPSLYGSNPWGALSCDQLRAPDEAGFAAVFLALRGTGTAWFDAFKLTRLSRFAVLQSPLDGETINDNTPMFDFQAPHDVEAAQVELSKTADFAEANVRRYTVHDTPWSCPEPLAAGRWHWRVVGSGLEPGVTWHFTQTAPPETDTTAPVIVTSAERIGQPRGRTVHVTVHEGSGVLRSVKATLGDTPLNVSFHTNSGDGEFCVHPEPDGEWPKGLSSLSVVASDPSGNETEAKVSVLNLPKPENAIRIDEEGFYLGPEGREFPFGIYQVRPENMKTVKEAGFDLVHMYTWESSQDDVAAREYLDAAWKHGLRVFIGFDRGNSSGNGLVQGNLDHIVRRVSALCDHPGLFCWYLFDEPEIVHQYISPRNLTRYADLIRTLDPYHPVVVTTWGKRMNLYRKSWDTHWTQAYKDPAGVVKQLQEHQKALLNASPITLLVHAYDRAQSKSGKPFDLGAFQPDPAWLRAAPYAGITQGINGLFWWWYAGGHADWLTIADVPEAWSALAATLSELRSLAPVLTGDGPVITRTINGGDGGPNVETWQKTVENGTTLIAVNTSESDGEVALPITASGPIRSLFGKTRTAAPESGRIRTHFGRYEVRVYQW
ncbi:MAG: hypothetical protein HON70_18840, partial [Lentisphaerae bacterium]|nr:hypothetical protein [Lentisphaerota bacterium]